MSSEQDKPKEGPKLILIPAHVDDRGFLWQLFENDNIKRAYAVGNFDKNTVRGLHLHFEESKWFFIIRGSGKLTMPDVQPMTLKEYSGPPLTVDMTLDTIRWKKYKISKM